MRSYHFWMKKYIKKKLFIGFKKKWHIPAIKSHTLKECYLIILKHTYLQKNIIFVI